MSGVLEDFLSAGTGVVPGDQYRGRPMPTHSIRKGYGKMSRGERAAKSATETRVKDRKLWCSNWCGVRKSFRLKKIIPSCNSAGDFEWWAA
jgi:hypothetical protein